jgi:hypothetical protein
VAGDLIARLSKEVEGLEYPSEEDAPFNVVTWPNDAAAQGAIQSAAKGKPPEPVPFDQFFDELQDTSNARRFAQLKLVLQQELKDLRVMRAGDVKIDIFILGSAPTGEIAGLHTTSVET